MNVVQFYHNPNPSTWKDLSDETRESFKNMVDILISNRNLHTSSYMGIVRIVQNLMSPERPMLVKNNTHIYGIRNWHYYYSDKYDMKVYILDDSHTLARECPVKSSSISITDVIIEQVKKAPCFVDLYLEIPYLNVDKQTFRISDNNFIFRTAIALKNCFAYDKINCEYPNLRAHYVDMRRSHVYRKLNEIFSVILYTYHINSDNVGTLKKIVVEFLNSKEYKRILTNKKSLTAEILERMEYSKIPKQLSNIQDQNVLNAIDIFVQKWLTDARINSDHLTWEYIQDVFETILSILNRPYVNPNNIHDLISPLFDTFAWYYGTVMDIYTVSRLFRTYQPTKNRYSDRARNVIILAGNAHGNRYGDFLKYLGFSYKHGTNSNNYCVSVNGMKTDWFA